VLYVIKRLTLGFCLIAAVSAILLFADRGRRNSTGSTRFQIAILKHADTPVLDEGVRGVIDGLAARGYRDGDRLVIARFNAQGDITTGNTMARQIIGAGYDLVVTSSTPSLQAVANLNRDGKTRHVFTLVADPFSAGVGLDRSDPLKHPPFMVGQSSLPPVERAFQLAREMRPELQRIGTAWNPAESNSVTVMGQAREMARKMGLTLLEANIDNSSAVGDAINSLIARDAEAIWVGADNTLISAITTVIAIGRRNNLPVFSVLPGAPDRGTLFDAGPNFYEVGKLGGDLVADVLEGADLTRIPVRDVLDIVPSFVSVNTTALKGLRDTWRIPADVLANADVVVDETGVRRKAVAANAHAPLKKKWRIDLVMLNRLIETEEAERGVIDGFKESGLVEGRDFERATRDAQGDMATVGGIIDTAIVNGADMLITFSTPALQAAMKKTRRVPIVFNYVADPIAAGAGTSLESHLPHVTGSFLVAAYEPMLSIVRTFLPRVHTIGTVYVPAEVNMVVMRDAMEKAAKEAGLELRAVAANSAPEVGEAAVALVAAGVDAIVQLPGNLTAAAFPSIAQVARRSRVPMFGFQSTQAKHGAVAVVARDYYDGGREAAHMAARVMRGESPATIPFVGIAKTRLLLNLTAARELGLTPPPALVSKADELLGK